MTDGLSWRFLHVVHRNLLVWRKLMWPSLVGNLAEPLLLLLGLGFGLGSFLRPLEGLPYISFLAGGMICYGAMNSASFEALYSAFTRLQIQRSWEGILHAPMTINDIVVGEWVWAAVKSLFSAAAIIAVMYLLGLVSGGWPLLALPVAGLVGLAFSAMALVVTAFARSYDFFVYYFTLIVTPMTLLSGVFFPMSALPAPVQRVAEFLPLAHGTALTRGLALGLPLGAVWLHLLVLLLYACAAAALALWLMRRRLAR
ncbi:MAG: ABC transporter permease [Steroidobacteraceae bacterium]